MSTESAAAPARNVRATARRRPLARPWLVVLAAGRREALWLSRSPLVLAGLVISAWLIWLNNHHQVFPYGSSPQLVWWSADVSIVACLLPAAAGVLIAAQLAAGRARRDGMEQLYASYPAAASARAGALLAGAAGPVALAVIVTGAGMGWLDSQGALGSPRLWVLLCGPLLVMLAGTAGAALGSWLGHPMAGILAALVLGAVEIDLVLSIDGPVHLPGGIAWLFPWTDPGLVLSMLPGLTVPYPPPAHLAELAGLIALGACAALWRVAGRRRAVAAVAVAAAVVTGWSGWSEARPVPAPVLAALVRQATQPQRVQACRLLHGVRYCYYPAYAPLVGQWAVPVAGVLAKIPRTAAQGLTVRQVQDEFFLTEPLLPPSSLTSISSENTPLTGRLEAFESAESTDPHLIPGSAGPPVYTDLDWSTGSGLGVSQLSLAVAVAWWATGLPVTGRDVALPYSPSTGGGGTVLLSCVPVGQAREAVALWLAAGATRATRGAFAASVTPRAIAGQDATEIGRTWIATVQENNPVTAAGLTVTARGAALAAEMLRLPARRVADVLTARWRYWLRPGTTEASLAAALGLPLPPAPAARPQPTSSTQGPGGQISDATFNPPSPVCR